MKQDFTNECIKTMAREAISKQKGLEFMLFWAKESKVWKEKAKEIFRKELTRVF